MLGFLSQRNKPKEVIVMKKLVVVLVLLLVMFSAFAADISLEGSLNIPNMYQHLYLDDPSDYSTKTVYQATAAGGAVVFDFTGVFGIGVWADLFQSQVEYAADLGYPATQGDYSGLIGSNILVGPVFYVFRQGGLRIPFVVGFHMFLVSTDSFSGSTVAPHGLTSWFELGVGISGALQYRFDNRTYIFSRLQISWDFWGSAKTKVGKDVDSVYSDTLNTFGIDPSFGVGITFGKPPANAPAGL
jgi:hypothetical protein